MKKHNFKNLAIWQEAIDLCDSTCTYYERLPVKNLQFNYLQFTIALQDFYNHKSNF